LIQAYEYAKFQFLRKDGWTQAMTKVYLQTCCMSGDVNEKKNIMVNEVKQNNAPKTIITLPVFMAATQRARNKKWNTFQMFQCICFS
jgi:hypothetical protein